MADNMWVTAISLAINNPQSEIEGMILPNPVSQSAIVSFAITQTQNVHVAIHDDSGKIIMNLFDGTLIKGEHRITLDITNNQIGNGIYFIQVSGPNFFHCFKLVVLH